MNNTTYSTKANSATRKGVQGTRSALTPDQLVDKLPMAIAGFLLAAPQQKRRTIMQRALNLAGRNAQLALCWPLGAFPNDATASEASRFVSGMGSLIYALGAFPKDSQAPVADVWSLAESGVTGRPAVIEGDPATGDYPGSLPAASAALVIADAIQDASPSTAEDIRELAAPYLKYDCYAHEGPLGSLQWVEAPMTGKIQLGKALANMGKKVVEGVKKASQVVADVQTGKAVREAATATAAGTTASSPNVSGILGGIFNNTTKKTEKAITELQSLGLDNGMARLIVAIAQTSGVEPVAWVKQTAVTKNWTMPQAARYIVLVAAGADPAEAEMIVTGGQSDEIPWTNDMDKYLADLEASMAQYRGRLEKTAERMKATAEGARTAERRYAKLKWADALLNTPDEAADILATVEPQAKTSSDLLASMLALIPAAKASGSTSTLGIMFAALQKAKLPKLASDLGLIGDPSDIESSDEEPVTDNPVANSMLDIITAANAPLTSGEEALQDER